MTPRPKNASLRVVAAPEVIAKSFLDVDAPLGPPCRAVLRLWRDGGIQLAVTRGLLLAYLKVLRGMGVPDEPLRHWLVWFTRTETSLFSPELETERLRGDELLADAAGRCGAEVVVAAHPRAASEDTRTGVEWRTVTDFLAEGDGR